MKGWLRKTWESRLARERRMLAVLSVILIATLYLSLATSAENARSRLHASVLPLQAQAQKFDEHASEYERLRGITAISADEGDLRALVQAQADAAGLSRTLASIDTLNADQVQVVFDEVPFAQWLAWVAAMQLHQVRLASGRIQSLPERGIVNVQAMLIRTNAE